MSPSAVIGASRCFSKPTTTVSTGDWSRRQRTALAHQVWAFCLMPNHVHLIVTPAGADGLRATFAEAHRRYIGAISGRFRWTGHLFQGHFGAVVMDEPRLLAAARYIALNPMVAGLVSRAEDWPWSSTRAQLSGEDDELAAVAPLRALIPDFVALLAMPADAATTTWIERASTIGRSRGARNGSRCSSAGSAALWHPANPAQSRDWSGTPRGKLSCYDVE
jgi:REP element-mobilizing transposase RayT